MRGERKFKIKIKPVMVSFATVFVMNLYFLYLIDPHYGTIMGIAAQDFALFVAILWGAYYWAKLIRRPNPPFRYGKWMITLGIIIKIRQCILSKTYFLRAVFSSKIGRAHV